MNGDWDEIATGYFHVLGLKSDQTIWAWGQNNYCQLGDGGTSSQRDSPNQIVCEALNTYSFSEPKDFVIYPNPVSSVLMIRPNGIEQIKKVTVYNLTGKKIVEQIGNGNELNVQELQEGIYLLKIESDKGCQQMKFIKQ
jgi:alpha-tubulin suppressor-like RCC1 family protein